MHPLQNENYEQNERKLGGRDAHQATACYVTFVHGGSQIYKIRKLFTSLGVQEARILKYEA